MLGDKPGGKELMRDDQWDALLSLIAGHYDRPAVGFIIDSPWLPGWSGMTIREYLGSSQKWFDANARVVEEFADVWFIPGFWAEFGMCTEPSAFGGKCRFPQNDFPHIEPSLHNWQEAATLEKPDCQRDGLLPFVIDRLQEMEPRLRSIGHSIRFAVSRGPLNIASYLLGQSEFLLGLKTEPALAKKLLEIITEFIVDWLRYQKKLFPTIDGILLLDDLLGFIGRRDFEVFAVPCLKEIYSSLNVRVKMLHNDAHGLVTAQYLQEIGINVFNFSYNHDFESLRAAGAKEVVLMGNINPRDVLASGTYEDLRAAIRAAWSSTSDRRHILWSAGGGMPPGVAGDKIRAFREEVNRLFEEESLTI